MLWGNLEQIIKRTTATSFYTFLEKIILHSDYKRVQHITKWNLMMKKQKNIFGVTWNNFACGRDQVQDMPSSGMSCM